MGALFAGIVNSGLMAAWVFILLDQVPEWRVKVIQELKSSFNKYAPPSGDYASAAERFSDVPLEAWENEMPILEDCLRETIRYALISLLQATWLSDFSLILSGAALRRVTQGDLEFEGKTIPNGYTAR
ncbi:hypothetical protein FRC08_010097 [Ceratobasidium sp. 394]|nr:hypothetical protein FRC08_010097 [Ceratobasidium sp. 394]